MPLGRTRDPGYGFYSDPVFPEVESVIGSGFSEVGSFRIRLKWTGTDKNAAMQH
jgi:hypothetical protein